MTRHAAAALLCLAGMVPAHAGEIFGSAGWRKTYDDEGSIGTGAAGRFGAGWRWSKKSGIEAEFGLARNRREITPTFVFGGRTQDLSLSVIRHFGNGKVEPYILGGGGLVHYTNLYRPASLPGSDSAFGYQLHAAFGVKAWIHPRFYLRPEVRLSAGAGSSLHRVVEPGLLGAIVSIGAGYRW